MQPVPVFEARTAAERELLQSIAALKAKRALLELYTLEWHEVTVEIYRLNQTVIAMRRGFQRRREAATMTLRERMRDRELTPFQRGWLLCMQMVVHGKQPTADEAADMLGYADASGARRILARNDLEGVYFDEETRRYVFALDAKDWPY